MSNQSFRGRTGLLLAPAFVALLVSWTAAQDGVLVDDGDGPISPYIAQPEITEAARQVSEYVREVYQDRTGRLWFGTNGDGVVRYDGESLMYLSLDAGFGGTAVRGIVEDPAGALWFATDGGVSRYVDGAFTSFTDAHGLLARQCWSIECDREGTIWVGTHAGVCRFNGERFEAFPLPRLMVADAEPRFSPLVSFAIHEDPNGTLWFATDGEGVHRWDGATFSSFTTANGLAGNVVRCITTDRHGHVWIGADGGGVSRFNGATFQTYTQADGLGNDRIYEVYETRDGTMWFSTLGASATRFDGTTFTVIPPDETLLINGRPAHSHVQEFFEDRDGVLWLGCSGGLFRYDGERFVNVKRGGPWPEATPRGNGTTTK